MNDVVTHLRACRDAYLERDRRPVVAWDCLGARAWAVACGGLADEIEKLGLDHDQAVAHLKRRADEARTSADGDFRGLGVVVSLDAHARFDEIIDPVARDRTGWIEVSGHAEHFDRDGLEGLPTYRRMLGVNRCVSTLTRTHREGPRSRWADHRAPRTWIVEDDEAWEERRRAWLGRYHPGVMVIHKEGGYARDPQDASKASCYTPLYGTVARHAAEPTPRVLPCTIGLVSRVPDRAAAAPMLDMAA